jgi:hypothetical protein
LRTLGCFEHGADVNKAVRYAREDETGRERVGREGEGKEGGERGEKTAEEGSMLEERKIAPQQVL